jgi:hypothetical protein
MFGNFTAQAGILASNDFSPNIVQPILKWNFSGVLVFDFAPTLVGNINDRPRINIWRTVDNQPDSSYLKFISGGRDVLSPVPIGRVLQPWGDRRTGVLIFPQTSVGYLKNIESIYSKYENFTLIGEPPVISPQTYIGFPGGFGNSFVVNDNNRIIYVGAPSSLGGYNNFSNSAGVVSCYEQSSFIPTQYSFFKRIDWQDRSSNFTTESGFFSKSLCTNPSGDLLLVGAPGRRPDINNRYFSFINNFAAPEVHLYKPKEIIFGSNPKRFFHPSGGGAGPAGGALDIYQSTYFGDSVAMSHDGTVIAITSPLLFNQKLFIYTGNFEDGYVLKTTCVVNEPAVDNTFLNKNLDRLSKVVMNKDGSIIAYASSTYVNFDPDINIFRGNKQIGWTLHQTISSNQIFSTSIGTSCEVNLDMNDDGNALVVGWAIRKSQSDNAPSFFKKGFAAILTGNTNFQISQQINSSIYPNVPDLNNALGRCVSITKDGSTVLVGGRYVGVVLSNNLNGWSIIDTGYRITNQPYFPYGAIEAKISRDSSRIFLNYNYLTINNTFEFNAAPVFISTGYARTIDLSTNVTAGIDLFTHSFVLPNTGTLKPSINNWTIDSTSVTGEIKYQYIFRTGILNEEINIDLDYNSGCRPVNIPQCNPDFQRLYYLGVDANGCPMFTCVRRSNILSSIESGLLYTNEDWIDGLGEAKFGIWNFISGSGSRRNISNSNQLGRQSIGAQAFFIVGNSGNLESSHVANYDLTGTLDSGSSLSVNVNYAWNGGSRDVIFKSTNNPIQYKFTHSNSDQITYDRAFITNGSLGINNYVITGSGFLKAFNYKVKNLGTGIQMLVSHLPSGNIIYSDIITGNNINWNTFITGLSFIATLGNVNPVDLNNYGLYFNSIQQDIIPKPPQSIIINDISKSGFLVNWEDVLSATGYLLDIAYDNNFINYLPGFINKNISDSPFLLNTLETNTNYYVRLRSINEIGTSIYSNTAQAKTLVRNPIFFDSALLGNYGCYKMDAISYTNTGMTNIGYRVEGGIDDDLLINNKIYESGKYPFFGWSADQCGYSAPINGAHNITPFTGILKPQETLDLDIFSYGGNVGGRLRVDFISENLCPDFNLFTTFSGLKPYASFGKSLSFSEDLSTIFVGGPGYDINNPSSFANGIGAVLIYTGNKNTGWSYINNEEDLEPMLILGNQARSDFGASLSTNYNGTILAVGAPADLRNNNSFTGKLYIYTKNNDQWILKNEFTGQNFGYDTNSSVSFGANVAMNKSGTVIATSDSFFPATNQLRGAIYIYTGNSNNGWKLRQTISGNIGNVMNNVKINNDASIILISAKNDITGLFVAGSVSIFTGSSQHGWAVRDKIWGEGGGFGYSLAMNEDISVFLVGCDQNDKAYAYTGNIQNGWVLKQRFSGIIPMGVASDIEGNLSPFRQSNFGYNLDVNKTASKLIFSEPGALNTSSGFVHIYCGNPTRGWELNEIKAAQSPSSDVPIVKINSGDLLFEGNFRAPGIPGQFGAANGGEVYIYKI